MSESSVRALAKAYFAGKIDAAGYRRNRTHLLDGITAGQIEIEYRQIPCAAEASGSVTSPPIGGSGPVVSTPVYADAKPQGSLSGKMIVAGMLLAALVIVPCIYFIAGKPGMDQKVQTAGPDQTHTVVGEVPLQQAISGRRLLTGFLDAIDWTPDGIRKFEQGWTQLSEKERQKARQSSNFGVMADRLQDHIQAQQDRKGLSDWGGADITALKDFARRIGLDIDPANEQMGVIQNAQVSKQIVQEPVQVAVVRPQIEIDLDPQTKVGLFNKAVPEKKLASKVAGPGANNIQMPKSAPKTVSSSKSDSLPLHELIQKDNDWALNQDYKRYAVQLGVFNDLDNLKKFQEFVGQYSVHFVTYKQDKKGGTPKIRVIYGNFPDKKAAERASETMPQKIKDTTNSKVEYTKFSVIQLYIKATQQND